MVDIETLGQSHTAVILSIGAVIFDQKGSVQDEFYRNITIPHQYKDKFTTDQSTIDWWKQQDKKIIKSLGIDKQPLDKVLDDFIAFFPKESDTRFWSRGCFDAPILTHAFKALNKYTPWHWANEMDLRTLTNFFNIDKPKNKSAHNALADCHAQLEHLKILLKLLGVE